MSCNALDASVVDQGTMRKKTEEGLISRAVDGDPVAVRAIYDRHADRVWAVIRRLAGDDHRAEDWAQEAWVRVFRALPGFRGEASLATWIHRIAVNAALDGHRRLGRRRNAVVSLPDGLAGPAGAAHGAVDRIALERAIDGLPDRMRRVLVLHDIEGYTHDEIGVALGVRAGTSRSQLFRARARLREALRAREPDHRRQRCAT